MSFSVMARKQEEAVRAEAKGGGHTWYLWSSFDFTTDGEHCYCPTFHGKESKSHSRGTLCLHPTEKTRNVHFQNSSDYPQ